ARSRPPGRRPTAVTRQIAVLGSWRTSLGIVRRCYRVAEPPVGRGSMAPRAGVGEGATAPRTPGRSAEIRGVARAALGEVVPGSQAGARQFPGEAWGDDRAQCFRQLLVVT